MNADSLHDSQQLMIRKSMKLWDRLHAEPGAPHPRVRRQLFNPMPEVQEAPAEDILARIAEMPEPPMPAPVPVYPRHGWHTVFQAEIDKKHASSTPSPELKCG